MKTETTGSTSEAQASNEGSTLEQAGAAPTLPRALSTIRITAFALLVMFFLPWGSIWIFTSCSSEDAGNGSQGGPGRYLITLGTASGWEIASGEEYRVPSTDGTSATVSIKPQYLAYAVPLVVLLIAGLSFATGAGRVPGDVVYAAALFGSLTVGIVTMYVAGHVSISTDQQPILDRVFAEYSSASGSYLGGYYNPHPSLRLQWNMSSWIIIFGLLTTMGVSSIVGFLRNARRKPEPGSAASRQLFGSEHELRGSSASS